MCAKHNTKLHKKMAIGDMLECFLSKSEIMTHTEGSMAQKTSEILKPRQEQHLMGSWSNVGGTKILVFTDQHQGDLKCWQPELLHQEKTCNTLICQTAQRRSVFQPGCRWKLFICFQLPSPKIITQKLQYLQYCWTNSLSVFLTSFYILH